MRRGTGGEQRVTALELFYDLVFVFAITQVSHLLLDHLTWEGVGQSVIVLLVVWWSWNYTTWVTNELDPDSIIVRLLLIALMLASFLMAIAIPDAFGDKALLFAGSYVGIQLGRAS
jgi:low temperature requirement protein LtrA